MEQREMTPMGIASMITVRVADVIGADRHEKLIDMIDSGDLPQDQIGFIREYRETVPAEHAWMVGEFIQSLFEIVEGKDNHVNHKYLLEDIEE